MISEDKNEMRNRKMSFWVILVFYIFGICTMLPWNFFITADKFWQFKLRNVTAGDDWDLDDAHLTPLQVAFMPSLVIISNGVVLLFGFVNSAIVNLVSDTKRILGSLVLSLISMAIITVFSIVDTDQWQTLFFYSTLTLVALLNVGVAIMQASLYGMAGFFPPSCMSALVSGQAIAGIVSSLAQIISLAIGNADPVTSGIIYFAIADAVLFATTAIYLAFVRMDLYKEVKVNILEESKRKTNTSDYKNWSFFKQVASKIKWMAFTLGFSLTITLAIFPAVQVYITSNIENSTPWTDVYFQPTITFLLFNVMDYVGREMSQWVQWPGIKGLKLHVVAACRVIFIPLIMLCNGDNKSFPTLFHHDSYYIIFNALLALTNGYFGCLTLIYYPNLVTETETELAGSLMASLMGVGMVIGSLLSPGFVALWGPNT